MQEKQVAVFSLNNLVCGIDTVQVHTIMRYMNVEKAPRMPKFVEGIINLRGTVVPIINLNSRFDQGEFIKDKKTKVIVSDIDGKLVGFVVNDVNEIRKFTEDEIEKAPSVLSNTYLQEVAKAGDKLVCILDFNRLLTDSEKKKLVSFQ